MPAIAAATITAVYLYDVAEEIDLGLTIVAILVCELVLFFMG